MTGIELADAVVEVVVDHRIHGVLCCSVLAFASPLAAQPANPPARSIWRLGEALDAPSWLAVGIEQRSRLEYLSNDFRATADHDTRALVFRSLIAGEARFGALRVKLELQDARAYASDDTPLNTTHVDPFEILQAYVGLERTSAFAAADQLSVKAGRMTIDLSSRRLVARNLFRNTVNAFTGVDATWTSPRKHVARAFVVVPVIRLPSDPMALANNSVELDREATDSLLWTAFYATPPLPALGGARLETYVLGFHERDGELASRNRQLITAGARWYRMPAVGSADFRLELMPQVGTSRATAAMDDVRDLDHRAFSSQVAIGVTAAMPWRPRFGLEHDYATGDRAGTSGSIETFDPLFGARRMDFGPVGIYGPFARSNLNSPGLRVSIVPHSTLHTNVGYRLFWLASATDAWGPAGVRDATGDSGRFLGEQVEAMCRWMPIPNLTLELGAAYLRAGAFAKTAGTGNAAYVYSQLSLRL